MTLMATPVSLAHFTVESGRQGATQATWTSAYFDSPRMMDSARIRPPPTTGKGRSGLMKRILAL
jgi:hypothetical protein